MSDINALIEQLARELRELPDATHRRAHIISTFLRWNSSPPMGIVAGSTQHVILVGRVFVQLSRDYIPAELLRPSFEPGTTTVSLTAYAAEMHPGAVVAPPSPHDNTIRTAIFAFLILEETPTIRTFTKLNAALNRFVSVADACRQLKKIVGYKAPKPRKGDFQRFKNRLRSFVDGHQDEFPGVRDEMRKKVEKVARLGNR